MEDKTPANGGAWDNEGGHVADDHETSQPLVSPPTQGQVIETLRDCYDPEIPVNVYDLGLIYGVEVDATGKVSIQMTLTSPACMMAEMIPIQIKNAVERMAGVASADVEVVWDPPWDMSKMSDEAKLELNLM